MIRIAIVEDETVYAQQLQKYLEQLMQERNLDCEITHFRNAVFFLEGYRSDFDLVFMDIRMPYLDGMEAAHRLREIDPNVLLIFITSLAQYAIKGYEVDALDYILKPVQYLEFALKMDRVLRRLSDRQTVPKIVISTTEGSISLPLDDIRYIETQGHHLLYHTGEATARRIYTQYATMRTAADQLSALGFARCNSCYLVNLHHVEKIKGYLVTVDGEDLQISQPKKKEFLQQFLDYTGRTLQ